MVAWTSDTRGHTRLSIAYGVALTPNRWCDSQIARRPTMAFAARNITQSPTHRAVASIAAANARDERRRLATPIEYARVDVTVTARTSTRSEKDILETAERYIHAPHQILAHDASHEDEPTLDTGRPLIEFVCDARQYAQSLAGEDGRCPAHVL